MDWMHYLIGLLLSMVLLVPLGWKWCIKMKIVIPYSILIGIASILLADAILFFVPAVKQTWIFLLQIFFIFFLALGGILFRFYRDPERTPPAIDGTILSPADGEIIYIKKIDAGESLHANKKGTELPINEDTRKKYFSEAVYVIGIMMNFLDVHVNRAPVTGRVEDVQHIKGRFLSLKKEKAYFQNERAFTIIYNGSFHIGVIQIASRLVRRIISYIKKDDTLEIGQRIGRITFGSQVDIIMPYAKIKKIEIKVGQQVKAGLSIIARCS